MDSCVFRLSGPSTGLINPLAVCIFGSTFFYILSKNWRYSQLDAVYKALQSHTLGVSGHLPVSETSSGSSSGEPPRRWCEEYRDKKLHSFLISEEGRGTGGCVAPHSRQGGLGGAVVVWWQW